MAEQTEGQRNARLGAQKGALQAVDMSEIDEPSGAGAASSRRPSARTQTKVVPLYQRTFARPGRLFAPPVPAARHVMLAITGSAVIFFVAGGRFDRVVDRVRGRPATDAPASPNQTFQTIMGWGVMLFILVFMADTGVMAPLAIGFSWLIFFMVLLNYGPEAANRVLSQMGQTDVGPDIEFGGKPGKRISEPSTVPNTAM